MARNRKRAKERRARRPQTVGARARDQALDPGLPGPVDHVGPADDAVAHELPQSDESTARVEDSRADGSQFDEAEDRAFDAPEDRAFDEPEVETAADPLPLQRQFAEPPDAEELDSGEAEFDQDGSAVEEEEEEEPEEFEPRGGRGGRGRARGGARFADGEGPSGGGELTALAAVAEHRALPGNRLLRFVEGSWHELQRVQWPTRPQVFQATGVVIGFVIVAALFLGAADWVAQKLVNLVLNGHF